jgi:hypothetical protein
MHRQGEPETVFSLHRTLFRGSLGPGALLIGPQSTLRSVRGAVTHGRIGDDGCAFVAAEPGEAGVLALRLVETNSGIKAATLHYGDRFAVTELAVAFAIHLSEYRARLGIGPRPCVTSPSRPDLVEDCVRLPHLVAVDDDRGHITDLAVWELMQDVAVPGWLGRPSLDSTHWLEDGLDRLLKLRRLLRDGQLPKQRPFSDLPTLLGGYYLSIRFVLQHETFFRTLLGEEDEWARLDASAL